MTTFLRSVSIRMRLALALGLLVLMVAVTALVGWSGVSRMTEAGRAVARHDFAFAQAASGIRYGILSLRRFEKDALLNVSDRQEAEAYVAKWRQSLERTSQRIAEAVRTAADESERAQLDGLQQHVARYAQAFGRLGEAIRAGQAASPEAANALLKPVKNDIRSAEDIANALNEAAARRVAAIEPSLQAAESAMRARLVGIALLAGLLALACAAAVRGSIRQPLDQVAAAARSLAAGDFTARVDASGRDELAGVLAALGASLAALSGTVAQVRSTAVQVGVGSQEIAQGNLDLSGRTEAQASSVQQTAAALEQLTTAVRQNADSAAQADRLAADVAGATAEGGQMVERVASTMTRIQDGARRIEAIIGTIDGIAFQTNILALNAAVEAARAGEAGRGFAVVASEVRALSQRSADAAREIRGLIAESVASVQDGAQLAAVTGSTIGGVVRSVQQLSGLIAEIARASNEQSSGLGQINQAVSALDESTQQNAALVEQLAASTRTLDEQSRTLQSQVAAFKTA